MGRGILPIAYINSVVLVLLYYPGIEFSYKSRNGSVIAAGNDDVMI